MNTVLSQRAVPTEHRFSRVRVHRFRVHRCAMPRNDTKNGLTAQPGPQFPRHTGPRVRALRGPRINAGRYPGRRGWTPTFPRVKESPQAGNGVVRPSRRPPRGLLRMRRFLNATKKRPHPEEAQRAVSKDAQEHVQQTPRSWEAGVTKADFVPYSFLTSPRMMPTCCGGLTVVGWLLLQPASLFGNCSAAVIPLFPPLFFAVISCPHVDKSTHFQWAVGCLARICGAKQQSGRPALERRASRAAGRSRAAWL